jgi:uncharacterized membrane protein
MLTPFGLSIGESEVAVSDTLYVVGVLAFLALTWGLVRLCDKVQ